MVSEYLLQRTTRETRRLIDLAEHHFRIPIHLGEIRFDLKGTTAGMVLFPPTTLPVIRYNPLLLKHNEQAFISQTLPHEVAHLVVHALYGKRTRPHGNEWRSVMAFFGAEAQRCHNYAMEHLPVRRLRRFPYTCGCRQHQLTSIRHNRIQRGQIYRCRQCGQPLRSLQN